MEEEKTIPLAKLIRIKEVFAPFYKQKIAAKLAFKIFRLCSEIEKQEQFYTEKLKAILDDCCEKTEKGDYVRQDGNIKVKPDKEKECGTAMSELDNMPVELPKYRFTEDELCDLTLSPIDAALISDFITEED